MKDLIFRRGDLILIRMDIKVTDVYSRNKAGKALIWVRNRGLAHCHLVEATGGKHQIIPLSFQPLYRTEEMVIRKKHVGMLDNRRDLFDKVEEAGFRNMVK